MSHHKAFHEALTGTQYMDDEQLAFFRERLLQQRRQLLGSLKEHENSMRIDEVQGDEFDRAGREESWLVVTGMSERHNSELRRIHRALERIEHGDYGYCAETGEPIGLRRLLAQPTADLSLEAQEHREREPGYRFRRHHQHDAFANISAVIL